MQRVLVLDTHKQPLMPTHPAKARKLLRAGQAAVYRRYPFTIILKYAVDEPQTQPLELKIDPGSKVSGISIVAQFARGWVALWAANLVHKGWQVERKLERRRAVRRSRRGRKTRYRQPRFNNRGRAAISYQAGERIVTRFANNRQSRQTRGRPSGWMSPSLQSRVDNVYHWTRKLVRVTPITAIQVETVRFDTHKLVNPEVAGVAYQQGELFGYEVKEYLLEKWGRKCAYCGAKGVPLQIEHVIPKSKGGSNRVSNLTLACQRCNQQKGNRTAGEFGYSDVQAQACQPLKDAAAVNSIRYTIGNRLKELGLSVGFWSGGRTKYNRIKQAYKKDHWIDAPCVGQSGEAVHIPTTLNPLTIRAIGRGSRQMCMMNRYGFPRTQPKALKRVQGFQTGDMVKAIMPTGKKVGVHIGRVAVRARGSFRVGTVDGINWKYCWLVQRADGYEYK